MIDPSGGLLSCWPYVGKRCHKDGYGYPKRNQKGILAHRWSYEHHYGITLDTTVVVRHKCDNPLCCNPLHLLIGSQADNVNDMMERKRNKRGYHPMTLSQQSIDKIIKLRRQGLLRYKIAEIVGCSACTVGKYCKQYKLQQPQLMESVVSLILLE